MKHVLPVLFLLFLFVFLFPKSVFAVTLTTTNSPSSIDINQEFIVDVDLVCTSCGASYLRGVFFYPESSTSYSGYTQNNAGEWINSSSSQATSYFKINEGSWSGQIKFKFDSTKPAGEYFFKVGRYTANNGSLFSSSPTSIVVTTPTSSPTTTQVLTSTPTQTSTPTPTTTTPPTSNKSAYKINSVKDSDGAVISNIKIYVDGNYTHHYAPETITFCTGCHCDDSNTVSCELGPHTIKLVKESYADWSEQKTFNPGDNFEVNPILSKTAVENNPTLTSTPTTTLTPTPKTSSPTPKASSSPTITITSPPESTFSQVLSLTTESGKIAPTPEIINPSSSVSDKNLFLVGVSVFSVSGGLLYFRLKNL